MNFSISRLVILICFAIQFEIKLVKGEENPATNGTTNQRNNISILKILGGSGPVTIEDIPQGQFRKQMDSLSPNSRAVALKKLSDLKIPINDLDSLQVDDSGEIFYSCVGLKKIKK